MVELVLYTSNRKKHSVICDATIRDNVDYAKVYENVTDVISADRLKDLGTKSLRGLREVGRAEQSKLIIFAGKRGEMIDIYSQIDAKNLSSEERARVEDAYIKRYGVKPQTQVDNNNIWEDLWKWLTSESKKAPSPPQR